MSDKGAAQAFWMVLIGALTIVGLLLLFPLFSKTKALSGELTDYHICKDGNIGIVKTRVKLFDWVIAEQGVKHCRTESVNVPSGKEYENIAKKMSLCWDMYLEGKEELFSTQDANYCAFCSVLEFEDKGKKLNELTKYLSDTKIPGSERKYMDYLSGIEAQGDKKTQIENLELQNNAFIDTSKKLAVMFVMYKDAYPGGVGQPVGLTMLGGGTAGALAGVGLGFYYLGAAALCTTLIGCFASVGLIAIGTGAGGTTGYLVGSDRSADWRARILVTEYNRQNLEQLKCTQLEGLDYLKIQKK
ncbi:hypothetical protein HYX05_01035 [Candidatus Woesearchaeota archaeon]|nr:hypothetical protein [Candidatus Woesearchaeota archaeon]